MFLDHLLNKPIYTQFTRFISDINEEIIFRNRSCYERQKTFSIKTQTSPCDLISRCPDCHNRMSKNLLNHHKCGNQKQCKICKKIVDSNHQCFVQVKPAKKRTGRVYIYLDFECTQEQGIHTPYLCVAHRVCQHCDHLPIGHTLLSLRGSKTPPTYFSRPRNLKTIHGVAILIPEQGT